MKKILLLAACFVAAPAFAQYYDGQPSQQHGYSGGYGNDQQVGGYTRSNGAYVEPYHRSAPDNTMYNNYSSQGNTNPYTGESGHVRPRY